MELREVLASSNASDCWWSPIIDSGWRLRGILEDKLQDPQMDPQSYMVGWRLLLSKRPELLFPSHSTVLRVAIFDIFCRQELLLPFVDILEEVYGQLFTFQYLNKALREDFEELFFNRSGGRVFWSSVFCHPLADLSMFSTEEYLDRPWTRKQVFEDAFHHLRLEDNSDPAVTLRELLEVGHP
jgi:hypothetical protein